MHRWKAGITMQLQHIYNVTYNYFSESNYWLQRIDYDKNSKNSNNPNIRNAFSKKKRDGLIYYLKTKMSLDSAKKVIQEMIQQLSSIEVTSNKIR